MKRFLLILIFGLLSFSTHAGRILPMDVDFAYIEKAQFPDIVLGSGKNHLLRYLSFGLYDKPVAMKASAAIRIADENNRWVVHGNLPKYKGKMIAFRLDYQKNINTMWVLTPKEEAFYLAKIKENKEKEKSNK